MQSLTNSALSSPAERRSTGSTASFRLMALLENGDAMLVRLVENPHEIRAAGEAAASEASRQRDRYWSALRADGPPTELDRQRPTVVSLYSERWVGSLTSGNWQPLSDRDGGNSSRSIDGFRSTEVLQTVLYQNLERYPNEKEPTNSAEEAKKDPAPDSAVKETAPGALLAPAAVLAIYRHRRRKVQLNRAQDAGVCGLRICDAVELDHLGI